MSTLIENCPACNNKNIKKLGKPELHEKGSKYIVVECMKCKLQWCNPHPFDEEMQKHYETYYQRRFQRLTKSKFKAIRDFLTLKYIREILFLKKAEFFSKINTFLDFGCGEGEMLLIGKKLGWVCTGTEYSSELKTDFEKLGVNVIVTTNFENSELIKNSYDLILFKHLIEHIKDIPNFLAQAKNYLTENGVMAIKTPSNTSFRAITNTALWHLVNPPEHLWSFNCKNFRLLLEKNGFEVLKIKNSLIVDELICYARIKK